MIRILTIMSRSAYPRISQHSSRLRQRTTDVS